jgi:PHD/YefM family antitoxin component YafN of YafNO toxin-antitoxin module
MKIQEEEKYPLPYYAKMEILLRIIDELKGTKVHREIFSVYRDIKADRMSKIFGLKLGRFLGLVESESKLVWLTDFGYRFSMLSEEQKRISLAENLPSYYITFLKWIKDSKDNIMDTDSLKADVLKTFKDWHPAPRVFHESLLTFGDVVEYCGFINFIKGSRGAKSRFQLTDKGQQILSGIKTPEQSIWNKIVSKQEPKEESGAIPISELPKKAHYPLIIQTRENKLDFDMTDEADWEIIKFMIEKLKAKWEEFEQHQEDLKEAERQQIKEIEVMDKEMQQGESAEDETGDESK